MNILKLNFDGACWNERNPPIMGIGVFAEVNEKVAPELHHSEMIGVGTNNVAEYQAFLKALEIGLVWAKRNTKPRVAIFGDSLLIVNQFRGTWECRKKHLQPFWQQAKILSEQYPRESLVVGWIPRERNKDADLLSTKCLVNFL
jgi:ribonuclease HI